jgi:hypothetical protein
VLLYLEHEARGEVFKFDPLIAPELLAAAETLNILGLQEACQKVLGSFKVTQSNIFALCNNISTYSDSCVFVTYLILNLKQLFIIFYLDDLISCRSEFVKLQSH